MSTKTNFGKWTFDRKDGLLAFYDKNIPGLIYQIPLFEINRSAKILDLIYQVEEKTWAKASVLNDLIKAFKYIFGREMCSGGIDRPFDPKELLTKDWGVKL
jgi:hypothetical protein